MERVQKSQPRGRVRLWMVLVAVGFLTGDALIPGFVVEPIPSGVRIELPLAGRRWEVAVRVFSLAGVDVATAEVRAGE